MYLYVYKIVYFSSWEPGIPLTHHSERRDTLNHDKTKAECQIRHVKLVYYGGTARLKWKCSNRLFEKHDKSPPWPTCMVEAKQ